MARASEQGWTVERALRELPAGARWELDEGRLEMHEPTASYHHGTGTVRVAGCLHAFVSAARLGHVMAGDPGFWLGRSPDTLRAPDVAYVSNERMAAVSDPDGFAEVAPDLVVEIRSPSDSLAALRRKAAQYLAFGVRSVWILDPKQGRLEQHLAGLGTRTIEDGAAAVEDPVLPGFRCALADLLPEPWPPRAR